MTKFSIRFLGCWFRHYGRCCSSSSSWWLIPLKVVTTLLKGRMKNTLRSLSAKKFLISSCFIKWEGEKVFDAWALFFFLYWKLRVRRRTKAFPLLKKRTKKTSVAVVTWVDIPNSFNEFIPRPIFSLLSRTTLVETWLKVMICGIQGVFWYCYCCFY